ncbi:hypothetical protein N7490_001845 [Penicillium lividum]|nr:hypothetical protein N7490_001845 [Penicillium lividum]
MSPTKISADASNKLEALAEWLCKYAEMKQQNNLIKCTDNKRLEKTLPLLKELGYAQIEGYGYDLYRISGETKIIKRHHLKNLFFPLSIGSEVQVAGETLTPGTFAQFDSTIVINAQLDCLIVYLPEGK